MVALYWVKRTGSEVYHAESPCLCGSGLGLTTRKMAWNLEGNSEAVPDAAGVSHAVADPQAHLGCSVAPPAPTMWLASCSCSESCTQCSSTAECQLLLQVTSVTENKGSESQTQVPVCPPGHVCPHLPTPSAGQPSRHGDSRPNTRCTGKALHALPQLLPQLHTFILYNKSLISLTCYDILVTLVTP